MQWTCSASKRAEVAKPRTDICHKQFQHAYRCLGFWMQIWKSGNLPSRQLQTWVCSSHQNYEFCAVVEAAKVGRIPYLKPVSEDRKVTEPWNRLICEVSWARICFFDFELNES